MEFRRTSTDLYTGDNIKAGTEFIDTQKRCHRRDSAPPARNAVKKATSLMAVTRLLERRESSTSFFGSTGGDVMISAGKRYAVHLIPATVTNAKVRLRIRCSDTLL
jgi:hypothetical protein